MEITAEELEEYTDYISRVWHLVQAVTGSVDTMLRHCVEPCYDYYTSSLTIRRITDEDLIACNSRLAESFGSLNDGFLDGLQHSTAAVERYIAFSRGCELVRICGDPATSVHQSVRAFAKSILHSGFEPVRQEWPCATELRTHYQGIGSLHPILKWRTVEAHAEVRARLELEYIEVRQRLASGNVATPRQGDEPSSESNELSQAVEQWPPGIEKEVHPDVPPHPNELHLDADAYEGTDLNLARTIFWNRKADHPWKQILLKIGKDARFETEGRRQIKKYGAWFFRTRLPDGRTRKQTKERPAD